MSLDYTETKDTEVASCANPECPCAIGHHSKPSAQSPRSNWFANVATRPLSEVPILDYDAMSKGRPLAPQERSRMEIELRRAYNIPPERTEPFDPADFRTPFGRQHKRVAKSPRRYPKK